MEVRSPASQCTARASGISRTWGSGPWLGTLRRDRWRDAWGKKGGPRGPRGEDTGESSKHGLWSGQLLGELQLTRLHTPQSKY